VQIELKTEDACSVAVRGFAVARGNRA